MKANQRINSEKRAHKKTIEKYTLIKQKFKDEQKLNKSRFHDDRQQNNQATYNSPMILLWITVPLIFIFDSRYSCVFLYWNRQMVFIGFQFGINWFVCWLAERMVASGRLSDWSLLVVCLLELTLTMCGTLYILDCIFCHLIYSIISCLCFQYFACFRCISQTLNRWEMKELSNLQ